MSMEKEAYIRGLKKALLREADSSGVELSPQGADTIATQIADEVDFKNPAVGHKGFSWLAKDIIQTYKDSARNMV